MQVVVKELKHRAKKKRRKFFFLILFLLTSLSVLFFLYFLCVISLSWRFETLLPFYSAAPGSPPSLYLALVCVYVYIQSLKVKGKRNERKGRKMARNVRMNNGRYRNEERAPFFFIFYILFLSSFFLLFFLDKDKSEVW